MTIFMLPAFRGDEGGAVRVPKEFIPELTVRENLTIPLTFLGIDKQSRDKMVGIILESHGLMGVAEVYPRFLEQRKERALRKAYKDLSSHYPNFEEFHALLKEKAEVRNCLFLVHHELFRNIARNLRSSAVAIKNRDYDSAVRALGSALDRLALRMAFSEFIDIPNRRVLDVLMTTIRTYYDVLRLREKVSRKTFQQTVKRAVGQLSALADAFDETTHIHITL